MGGSLGLHLRERCLVKYSWLLVFIGVGTAYAAEMHEESAVRAVAMATEHVQACRNLGDFYWEIGDVHGAHASGSVGQEYSQDKVLHIASASKWVFGSYVLEKLGRELSASDPAVQALEMQSGYVSLKHASCIFSRTVEACFQNRSNDVLTSDARGKFFYNGGHDQKLAVDLGLGSFNSAQFGSELNQYLGGELNIKFGSPQPAGGMEMTPSSYAAFLRHILSGQLKMSQYLGRYPVCTLPGVCQNAIESPVPLAWHYSLNHWIEDDSSGDGAYSSPGAFGFYPWISADRKWYGILARESHRPRAYQESVICGQQLRQAWMVAIKK